MCPRDRRYFLAKAGSCERLWGTVKRQRSPDMIQNDNRIKRGLMVLTNARAERKWQKSTSAKGPDTFIRRALPPQHG